MVFAPVEAAHGIVMPITPRRYFYLSCPAFHVTEASPSVAAFAYDPLQNEDVYVVEAGRKALLCRSPRLHHDLRMRNRGGEHREVRTDLVLS
jgi:hypothetical protein